MRLWIALLAVLLLAAPAWSAPTRGGGPLQYSAREHTVDFDDSTVDSPSIPVGGTCSATFILGSGGGTVSLYQVPSTTTAASSGTLVTTFSATTTVPHRFTPGNGWVKAVAASDSDGSKLTVTCSYVDLAADDLVDENGDGIFELVKLPRDYDGDGTAWRTCDCSSIDNPTEGYNADWLCGEFATSETDFSQADWSAGDATDNPEGCWHHGQRIWDDIGDDTVAIEYGFGPGTRVEFEPGSYHMQGTLVTDSTLCWNSTTEAFDTTCPTDQGGPFYEPTFRHSNMHIVGAGVDADGIGNGDLRTEGTHFFSTNGLQDTWSATPGRGSTISNGQMRLGDKRPLGSANRINVLLGSRKGRCDDGDAAASADGTCDQIGGSTLSINIDNPDELCLDEASNNYVSTVMEPGQQWSLSQQNMGSGIGRVVVTVESIGGVCGTGGLLVTFGPTPYVQDQYAPHHGISFPFEVWGSQDATGTNEPTGYLNGPVEADRWPEGIQLEGVWFSHYGFPGAAGCELGTEAECDQGSLMTIGVGFNTDVHHIGILNSGTAFGSGGAINTEPYSFRARVRDSLFRYNRGASLIDISNYMLFERNVVLDNVAREDNGGSASQTFIIRNQGFFYEIRGNHFDRNQTPTDWASSVVEMIGDGGVFEDNYCGQSSSTCLSVAQGTTNVNIRNNVFDVGEFIDDGTERTAGFAIYIGREQTRTTDGINIENNNFLRPAKFTAAGEAAPSHGGHIAIGNGNEIYLGGIGELGINVRNNFFQNASDESYVLLVRGLNDPENSRILFDGNRLTQGHIAASLAWPAATGQFDLDTAGGGGTVDDGIGLITCGTNWIGTAAYTSFAWSASRDWPTECLAQPTESPFGWGFGLSTDAPDCAAGTTKPGTIYTVINDGSAGACTSTGGVLNGSGSATTTCVCQGAGTWAEL